MKYKSDKFSNSLIDCFLFFKDQSKISIKLDRLTSTSVLIRWNSVQFSTKQSSSSPSWSSLPHYKLEYWLQSNQANIITHDHLNSTQLQLRSLKPNSDYLVQIIAISDSGHTTSEPALRHFRTLLADLPAPANIQLVRYESESDLHDKVDLKWDNPQRSSSSDKTAATTSTLKGYRIYYKELLAHGQQETAEQHYDDQQEEDEEEGDYEEPLEGSDEYEENGNNNIKSWSNEWKVVEFDLNTVTNGRPDRRTNEFTLAGLKKHRDYAIKIVALDYANNEGEESAVHNVNRLLNSGRRF